MIEVKCISKNSKNRLVIGQIYKCKKIERRILVLDGLVGYFFKEQFKLTNGDDLPSFYNFNLNINYKDVKYLKPKKDKPPYILKSDVFEIEKMFEKNHQKMIKLTSVPGYYNLYSFYPTDINEYRLYKLDNLNKNIKRTFDKLNINNKITKLLNIIITNKMEMESLNIENMELFDYIFNKKLPYGIKKSDFELVKNLNINELLKWKI